MAGRAPLLTCPHCGSPSEEGTRFAPFCCTGCQAVFGLLSEGGLDRYYALGGRDGVPASPTGRSDLGWLDPLLPEGAPGAVCGVDLDVQGIHCAACVWLMNELFRRHPGAAGITVNPALGKVRLNWERGVFDVRAYLREVERFGYVFGPSRKEASRGSRDLPLRMGICAAIAMNVMMFSISFYVGLAPADGEVFQLFTRLSLYLSAGAVAIGGWPFFKAAWQGLTRGILHLDLPIAAGILLAFGTSLLRARAGRGDLAYFDTLDVFITLMLVGRWLQQRVLDRNRRFLLEDAGVGGILVRREEEGRLHIISAPEVRTGDLLLLAPGDLVPVPGVLVDTQAELSTDWINGESRGIRVEYGAPVPAGAFNAGRTAIRMRATAHFEDSPLVSLLQARRDDTRRPRYAALTERVSRVYVPVVLALAAFALWLWHGAGWPTALDVTVAILVVTCPCALGIAVPLAEELAFARLRRAGVFVRNRDLLERAVGIRRVLFDKTGTLTMGRMVLTDPAALETLEVTDRDALYDLAARSNHPVSRALTQELSARRAHFSADARVTELPGAGLTLDRDGHEWRLGKRSWATSARAGAEVTILSRDGVQLAALPTREATRSDAREELRALGARGIDVWLLSGDAPDRVSTAATALGIPSERVRAGMSPEEKARVVTELDHGDALFIGDGVNDSLAFSVATACGTPAIDRPVMPARSDFFLLGENIAGVRKLLETSQLLRTTIRRILTVALTYNALSIVLCLMGFMTPLRAAVAMPASSLVVILMAMASFSHRQAPAKAAAVAALRTEVAVA